MRSLDLTSTEIGALFGISPYVTEFELWHRKKEGRIVQVDPNERIKWGTRLQDAIAFGIAEDKGWVVRRKSEYIRIPELRLGASFDYEIPPGQNESHGQLLEIKNVDSLIYRDGWLIDGDNIEAPPHIEMQVQHQLLVSGCELAYIGALVGGNRVVLIEREADDKVQNAILMAASRFWQSIDENKPPQPNFKRDADFIKELYSNATIGKHIDATERISALVADHERWNHQEKEAKLEKEGIKAELLTLIGDAEKVVDPRFTISLGMVGPAHIEYEREAYRNFRIFPKKEKK